MNNKVLLILVALLVWHSGAYSIGVAVASPTTTTAFSCLVDQDNSLFIVRIYKANETYQGIDPNGYQNLINANAAYSQAAGTHQTHAYMEPCRNGSDPIDQVLDMLDESPARLYRTIYVKVIPCHNPGCSWESYTHQENCDFLTLLLAQLQSSARRINVGVFSTANIWAEFFGNTCDHIGALYPTLWYGLYDTNGELIPTQTFGDFISFGGWSAPYLKQTYGNTTATNLCNNEWHVYLDRVYRPWVL